MKFSQCLSAIFVCLVYSTLSTCAPTDQSYMDRLRQELQSRSSGMFSEHDYMLTLMTAETWAASAGKTIFKLSEGLSEDCIKTAMVAVNLQSRPSTWSNSLIFTALQTSANTTLHDIMTNVSMTNSMERYCYYVNLIFASLNVVNFAELKKAIVELPKPAQNYYFELQPGKSLQASMGDEASKLELMKNPEMLRGMIMIVFRGYKHSPHANPFFANVFDALTQLANGTLKATVDEAVLQALDDAVKWELSQIQDDVDLRVLFADLQQALFVPYMDGRARENAALSVEYKKIMKELFLADRKNRKSQLKKQLQPDQE